MSVQAVPTADEPTPFNVWTQQRQARIVYSYPQFAAAKLWFFMEWTDFAQERQVAAPQDLSGSCKYGSLFMQSVFGGVIRGHFAHQFNHIDGRLVDLSHDALDVGRMHNPYLHEPDYFALPALKASLVTCLPRAERWANRFVATCPTHIRVSPPA